VHIAQNKLEGIEYYTPEHRLQLKEVLAKAADGLAGFEV